MDIRLEYRRQSLNHRLLDAPEETELIRRAQAGDSEALSTLVELNQRLVAKIAGRYTHSSVSGDLDMMDLIQYGNEGLIIAIRRFDQSKGYRLSTYITWWIRQSIRRKSLMHGTTLHRSAREGELIMSARKLYSEFVKKNERQPEPAEIAARMNVSKPIARDIVNMLYNANTISLDQENLCGDDKSAYDGIPDSAPSVEDQVIEGDETTRLHEAISRLPKEWQRIIIRHYGLDGQPAQSLADVAADCSYPVSRETVRQIERNALIRLRLLLSPPLRSRP